MSKGGSTYRFDLLFVEFSAVEEESMDAVACSGCLDGCWSHIQEVLGRKRTDTRIKKGTYLSKYT